MNPILLKDFYKVGHFEQYPKGTELIFSNFTPRKSKLKGINHAVLFGLKYFISKYLIKEFNENFFNSYNDYDEFINVTLGGNKKYPHIENLRKLGHLPLSIYSLPELSFIP